jgi:hypothetical protein
MALNSHEEHGTSAYSISELPYAGIVIRRERFLGHFVTGMKVTKVSPS